MEYKVDFVPATKGDIENILERRINSRYRNGLWKFVSVTVTDNGLLIVFERVAAQ